MKRYLFVLSICISFLGFVMGPAQATNNPNPIVSKPTQSVAYDYISCFDVYHQVVTASKKMKLRTCMQREYTTSLSGAKIPKRLRTYVAVTCRTDLVSGNWSTGRLHPCSFQAYRFLMLNDEAVEPGEVFWDMPNTGNDGFASKYGNVWWSGDPPGQLCTGTNLYSAQVHWYNMGLDGSRQYDYVRQTDSYYYGC